MPKRQKQIPPVDIKKKKSAYEKEDKKSHCRCARKTGPIRQAVERERPVPHGCDFAFLGGLFLYKAYACLGEAKPRRLVQDKHTPKCQMGLNTEKNHVVVEGFV